MDVFRRGAVPQLARLRDWMQAQRSFLFFQASVLITYEGLAASFEEANVQVLPLAMAYTHALPHT